MQVEIATLIAVAIPVLTEIGIQWKKFPLERKNAPFVVLGISFALAFVYRYVDAGLTFDVETVSAIFGYTTITTAFATFLYEYVYKLSVRAVNWIKSKI